MPPISLAGNTVSPRGALVKSISTCGSDTRVARGGRSRAVDGRWGQFTPRLAVAEQSSVAGSALVAVPGHNPPTARGFVGLSRGGEFLGPEGFSGRAGLQSEAVEFTA